MTTVRQQGLSSSTQLPAICLQCHNVGVRGFVFLLNEDNVDRLDTWNPVVLRLELWRENQTG